jgi:hypothetical protein
MVISMVDVGEQTGALPEMLMKIADNYDDEVDNAVAAMTSLLEPIMIVFLAVVVGSIVIALFLPLITLIEPELRLMESSVARASEGGDSVTITLRIDPRMLARIKRLARSRFLNYQSMIKQWLSERMEHEMRDR